MSLESYEDALSNITLTRIDKMSDLFGEKYLINYMLDMESRDSLLNLEAFSHPFEYQMKITRKNETQCIKLMLLRRSTIFLVLG